MNIVVLSSAAAQSDDLKKRAVKYFAGKSTVNIQAFTSQEEVLIISTIPLTNTQLIF